MKLLFGLILLSQFANANECMDILAKDKNPLLGKSMRELDKKGMRHSLPHIVKNGKTYYRHTPEELKGCVLTMEVDAKEIITRVHANNKCCKELERTPTSLKNQESGGPNE